MKNNEAKQEKYNSPVKAIFTGVSDLFRKTENILQLHKEDRLDGKKVMITGASSGLGLATAVEAAKRGAHVIMAVRSGIPEKGELVKIKSGSDKVDMVTLDLSDLSSLPSFTAEISKRFGQLDVVICNAAMVASNSRPTKENLDEMFVVNYFSKFVLLRHLLDNNCLNISGNSLPRIVVVTSESHRNPKQIEWDTFGKYIPYGTNKSVAMYGYYKLLLLTLVNEFSRRLNPAGPIQYAVHALCPGPVNTNIAREAPRLFHPLLRLVFSIFFRSPEKACMPVIYLATSKEIEGETGKYLFLMEEKPMDDKATDPENGKHLWELSEKLQQKFQLKT